MCLLLFYLFILKQKVHNLSFILYEIYYIDDPGSVLRKNCASEPGSTQINTVGIDLLSFVLFILLIILIKCTEKKTVL